MWPRSKSLGSTYARKAIVPPDRRVPWRRVGVSSFKYTLKAQPVGEIEVAGPDLAGSLTNLGLIDEYRLYLHPIVLGRGKPFFSGPRPPLRLVTSDLIAEDVIRLTYVPA